MGFDARPIQAAWDMAVLMTIIIAVLPQMTPGAIKTKQFLWTSSSCLLKALRVFTNSLYSIPN